MSLKNNTLFSINILASFICIFIALCGVYYFPIMQIVLLFVVIVTYTWIIISPQSWLIILPIAIVGLNLAPWSGRFHFTEFDIVTLTICSALFFSYSKESTKVDKYGFFLIIALLTVSLISTPISLAHLFSPHSQNPYYELGYGFKILKGILYATVLGYFLNIQYSKNKLNFQSYLTVGATIASIIMFLIILWERQTLSTIIEFKSISNLLSSLLNVSTSYRATSLISDMHTGGESLDGVYLTLLTFNLFAFVSTKNKLTRALSLIGLSAILYCIMVGFTRATYVSAFITIGAFFALKNFPHKPKYARSKLIFPSLIIISAMPLYHYVGYFSIVTLFLLLFAPDLLQKILKNSENKLFLIPIFMLATLVSIYGHLSNIWVTPTSLTIVGVLAICALLCIANVYNDKKSINANNSLTLQNKGMVILVAIGLAIMFGGSRIQQRLQTVGHDLNTRITHWSSVLDSSEDTLKSVLFGNGWGSFPRNYLINYPELVKKVGSFAIKENTLTLGGGQDLALGQRVPIFPNQLYTIEVELTTPEDTSLSFMLCERNLIIFDRWAVKCAYQKQNILATNQKQRIKFELNSKKIGEKNILERWPTVFIVRNFSSPQPVLIYNLQVFDKFGNEILKNPNFSKGLDNWFFYSDFEHLPWHIKNIYLALYYQTGIVGIMLFIIMLGTIIYKHLNQQTTKEQTTLCLTLAVAMLSFGFFGDPLDSSRVSSIFFALLFMVLFANQKPKIGFK